MFHGIISPVEKAEKKVESIVVLVGGGIAEGIIIKELLNLISDGFRKHILEASLLIAGIIGVAYLVIRVMRWFTKD